jgi:glycosyltransferase involved in cell wall biosynthesis
MSAGCVPIVVNKGGQKEIVRHEKDGYLFNSEDELLDRTMTLIKNNDLLKKYSESSVMRAMRFSTDAFYERVSGLL